jgi:hypothetical protein
MIPVLRRYGHLYINNVRLHHTLAPVGLLAGKAVNSANFFGPCTFFDCATPVAVFRYGSVCCSPEKMHLSSKCTRMDK